MRWPNASAPSSSTACRTCCAVAVDGSGAPNVTVTRYGTRVGHFQKKRPFLKLKTLPHTWSRYTGITGTSSPSAMRSKPLVNGSRFPVRLIAPSAKMHTTWPCRSSSRARPTDANASPRSPTGIAFSGRISQLRAASLEYVVNTLNRTDRGMHAPTRSPSMCDR